MTKFIKLRSPDWRSNLSKWFYLPSGNSRLILRLLGLWLLCSFPGQVLALFKEPYLVSSWRIGMWQPELPPIPLSIQIVLAVIHCASAIQLLFGKTHKIFCLIPVLVIALWGTYEYSAFWSTYSILIFLWLIAFLFYRESVNCTRRLIQITITVCYLFSVLQKLQLEWIKGYTLNQIFGHGSNLCSYLIPLMRVIHISRPTCALIACSALVLELFLAFGFYFKTTKRTALYFGVAFHLAILFCIGEFLFSFIMYTGYLAFFEKVSIQFKGLLRLPAVQIDNYQNVPGSRMDVAHSKWETFFICIFIVLNIWMPLRFFVGSDIPFMNATLYDSNPWGFAMYKSIGDNMQVSIQYLEDRNDWREEVLRGRMRWSCSKSDLLAATRYELKQHPSARKIVTAAKFDVNGHWHVTNRCVAERYSDSVKITFNQDNSFDDNNMDPISTKINNIQIP